MQNWTTEIWLAIGGGFALGFIFAYVLISLTKSSVKKQAETEMELKRVKEELLNKQVQLEKHFAESADLFKTLAQDYQKIYRHLAKSSETLLPDAGNKAFFLQSFMTSDKSTADINTTEEAPKDYKEGSSGILKAER